jgi:hypothetical protein
MTPELAAAFARLQAIMDQLRHKLENGTIH